MSLSNNFIVKFEGLPPGVGVNSELVEYTCDEAQLPNVNTATGSQTGLYTGLGNVDYPHTRIYTELQLGFLLDANLTVLKFLNQWHDYIFSEEIKEGDPLLLPENRVTKLRYKNEYACTIKITKAEVGPDSMTSRRPITYVLEKAFPFAIDAIPLQYGTSQITKVTAQFKYQRHYTQAFDITKTKGNVNTMKNGFKAGSSKRITISGPKTAAAPAKEPVVWTPKTAPGPKTAPPLPEEPIVWSPEVVPGVVPNPQLPPIVW